MYKKIYLETKNNKIYFLKYMLVILFFLIIFSTIFVFLINFSKNYYNILNNNKDFFQIEISKNINHIENYKNFNDLLFISNLNEDDIFLNDQKINNIYFYKTSNNFKTNNLFENKNLKNLQIIATSKAAKKNKFNKGDNINLKINKQKFKLKLSDVLYKNKKNEEFYINLDYIHKLNNEFFYNNTIVLSSNIRSLIKLENKLKKENINFKDIFNLEVVNKNYNSLIIILLILLFIILIPMLFTAFKLIDSFIYIKKNFIILNFYMGNKNIKYIYLLIFNFINIICSLISNLFSFYIFKLVANKISTNFIIQLFPISIFYSFILIFILSFLPTIKLIKLKVNKL